MSSRVRTPLLAAAGCVVAFCLVLAIAYGVAAAGRADATALNGLIALRGPIATPLAIDASHLADPVPVAMIMLGLAAFGWAFDRPRQAVAAAVLVVVAPATAELLKVVLAHARPEQLIANAQVGAAAFPSGHATASMAVALAAVLVVPRRIRPVVAAGGAAYAIAVSTSILILAWHYPSDIFGGMLLAAFYFCVAVAVLRALPDRVPSGDAEARLMMPRAPVRWREGAVVVSLVAAAAFVARAENVTAFASEHTLATVTAIAVAACAAALVAAASVLTDRA